MKAVALIVALAGLLVFPEFVTGHGMRRGAHGPPSRSHAARRGVVVVAPPVTVIRATPFIFSSAPLRYYRPWIPYRSQTVVYDVPYVPELAPATGAAPGTVNEELTSDKNAAGDYRTRAPGQLAPFDPTPQDVVDRMLSLSAPRPGELLYDLGAGDGRVVIAAAKQYGVKAVGFEVDPGLVKLARENIRKAGMEEWVEIRQEDFLRADLSPASVVTLYLSQDGNQAVRPRLINQLKAGARVVSYTFDMSDWPAKIAQTYRDGGGNHHLMFLWEIGAPALSHDAQR